MHKAACKTVHAWWRPFALKRSSDSESRIKRSRNNLENRHEIFCSFFATFLRRFREKSAAKTPFAAAQDTRHVFTGAHGYLVFCDYKLLLSK